MELWVKIEKFFQFETEKVEIMSETENRTWQPVVHEICMKKEKVRRRRRKGAKMENTFAVEASTVWGDKFG